IEHGRLYGLGSNDAGASVVSLMATFLHFYPQTGLNYNLCLALTAEEECSGELGIEALLPCLPKINCAIVGEPTLGQMAIGERGLMVLDCVAKGRSGHAAREEGDNAIYHALNDIEWFKNYRFAKVSPLFGPVKMSVTIINSGTQHNVVPAECRFTVDVRVTECYTLEQVLALIRENVTSTVTPRSLRLNPSKITLSHPLVVSGLAMGLTTYGSPTTSDAALLYGIEALKMGPGDSARSHSADEYVYISEVTAGIKNYITLLDRIL
ncbi:MAG: M20/M25/M40 family metallo-hydrolase, partial [Mucinivorans sp.]